MKRERISAPPSKLFEHYLHKSNQATRVRIAGIFLNAGALAMIGYGTLAEHPPVSISGAAVHLIGVGVLAYWYCRRQGSSCGNATSCHFDKLRRHNYRYQPNHACL